MFKITYKGIRFPIDVEFKDLPQDGQRIVSFLEEKAEKVYDEYKQQFVKNSNGVLRRTFEAYTRNYGFIPQNWEIYTFIKKVLNEDIFPKEVVALSTLSNLRHSEWMLESLIKTLDNLAEKDRKERNDLQA